MDPVFGGGTVERTLQISREMSRIGINVVVLTTDIGLSEENKKAFDGFEVIALPCIIKRLYLPKFSYKHVKKLVADSDVVHLMGHWTFLNALVYYVAKKLKKPYVVCPAGALPIYGRSKIIKKLYNLIVGNKIISNATACVAVAVNEKAHFKGYGVDVDMVSFIPNGVNNDDFTERDGNKFRKKYHLGLKHFILFVGRLNYIKGPDLLLRAFSDIQDKFTGYHLVFAGPDGGMLKELKSSVAHFSLEDRVHFIGYLGLEDKVSAYQESALLVIPSRQEAMSIVVLEAGISNKPVLITDQCGFNDIEDVNGGLVVSASSDSIRNGLIEVLGDPEKLFSMGKNLESYVRNNFTWKIAVDKYIQLYHIIMNNEK